MVDELRIRLNYMPLLVVPGQNFKGCQTVTEFYGNFGLKAVEMLLCGAEELPAYGRLNLAEVKRADLSNAKRTRSCIPELDRAIGGFINDLSRPGAKRKGEGGLSPKSVRNYKGFVSTVFAYAVRMGMLRDNPCSRVTVPALHQKEKKCYDLDLTQSFLDALLEDAPLRYQVFFAMAIFGGYRREELCGFEFDDMDFKYHTATVNRVSIYTKEKGITTGPPKTERSQRTLKLPLFIFDLIKGLRAEQAERRLLMGDQWHECGRLFTKQDGTPVTPHFAYQWLQGFCKAHGFPCYGVHQFRHLNATLLIGNGEDVRTVAAALGHSQPSTTLNIYTHAFASAQARASRALADQLPVKFGKKAQ